MKQSDVAALETGLHSIGDNLYIQVSTNKISGKRRTSWIYRYRFNGKTRDMGLGSYPKIPEPAARRLAAKASEAIQAGTDPIQQRRIARGTDAATAEKLQMTLQRATSTWLASNKAQWKKAYSKKWERNFELHLYPKLGKKLVGEITKQDVTNVLMPIFDTAPAQARIIQTNLETIMAWCVHRGYSKTNPAEWKKNLEFEFKRKQVQSTNHASLPWQDAPAYYKELTTRSGIAPIAIKFILLTAVRANEALKADWSEISLEQKLWTIPASRMKIRKEHKVPLSDQAIALIRSITVMPSGYMFPGYKGKHLNDTVLRELKSKLPFETTIHGLRSTFRSWADDCTEFAHEVKEASLAHQIPSAVERAYVKTTLLDKRRELLNAWAKYLTD